MVPVGEIEKFLDGKPEPTYRSDSYAVHSSGVMTLVDVGNYRIRWDVIATTALRRHMKMDTDEEFQKFINAHIRRWFKKHPPNAHEILLLSECSGCF